MTAYRLGSDAELSSKRNVVIHVIESAGRFRRGRCLPVRALALRRLAGSPSVTSVILRRRATDALAAFQYLCLVAAA